LSATDTNLALHYYSDDNVRTTNGVLNISSILKSNWYKAYDEEKKYFYADQKFVQSGMVQSWNKFCFIGGIVEFRAKLPGDPSVGGLWPARECELVSLAFSRSFVVVLMHRLLFQCGC
jgi:beta-glucanase (GH16 family)